MLLDMMIPFHLRHPLEPLLIGSLISLVMMIGAFSLMSRAHRLQRGERRGGLLRGLAGLLIGTGAYLATMALVTSWVDRPYTELLPAAASLVYLAMGIVIGTGFAFAPSRVTRIAAGAALGAVPILTVLLRLVLDTSTMPAADPVTKTTAFFFVCLALKAGTMTGVGAWLCASPSHITRAGAALFCTSALTTTLSAVPALVGQPRTVWTTSTGIMTPYAAWAATAIVFVLIACAIAEHFRLASTERSRRAMQRSQDRLDGLTKAAFEGLIVHRNGLVVDWNEQFCAMSLWRPFRHLPPAPVTHLIEGGVGTPDRAPVETVLKRRDGTHMPVEILSQRLAPEGDDPTIVTAVRDITQRVAQDAAIAHLARHDGLTDLLNRTAFAQAVEERLARDGTGALLVIDLDHFKPVNDTHGHPAGDHVLRVLAKRFGNVLRAEDMVARLGGDEFAVFVARPDLAPHIARTIGERLVEAACRPITLDHAREPGTDDAREPGRAQLSASVGIAAFPEDAEDFDTLLSHADAALYRVKAEGRNGVRRYDPRMHAYAEERAQMAADLRTAVREGRITVAYQPIFDVASGETVALEALARWSDAFHGDVEPETFLALAEEARLMVPLGWAVMRDAFATAAETGLDVCINVAPQQLAAAGFAEEVARMLDEAGIAASAIELEVTERVLRETEPVYLETLEALAALGFRIALDDFGSGPSALSALHRYPFKRIKLDGAFLRGLHPDVAPELLAAVLRLARVQKLQVTAEGIESHAELALMTKVGLDAVQGYLLGRPGKAAATQRRLDQAA